MIISLFKLCSGDVQFIICLKCCKPSNSIIIFTLLIINKKSNGSNLLFLQNSFLYCFIILLFIYSDNKKLYNLPSVLFLHKEHSDPRKWLHALISNEPCSLHPTITFKKAFT